MFTNLKKEFKIVKLIKKLSRFKISWDLFKKVFNLDLKIDEKLHSFKSFRWLFQSFAAWKIKVCLPQFVLGTGKRISLERLVLYEWTAWFLVKLNLKSVSPIRHLWVAMQRWKNLLVDSDFRFRLFSASVDKLRGGCPSITLAALFCRISISDIMVSLFLSPDITSP